MTADERRAKVRETLRDLHGQATSVNKALDQLDTIYRDFFLELIGDVEQRETEDLSLQSWTPEDYKAFGKNELRVKLRQQVTAALGKDGDE
jgi:hypothetical protein